MLGGSTVNERDGDRNKMGKDQNQEADLRGSVCAIVLVAILLYESWDKAVTFPLICFNDATLGLISA